MTHLWTAVDEASESKDGPGSYVRARNCEQLNKEVSSSFPDGHERDLGHVLAKLPKAIWLLELSQYVPW